MSTSTVRTPSSTAPSTATPGVDGAEPVSLDPARTDPAQTDPAPGDPAPTDTEFVRGAEPEREPVDLRVTGRNVEVPEHFRAKVAEKLERMERYDPSLHRFAVELTHERNRRQSKSCQRVEITGLGKGPVVRAEACADSFYAALEGAVTKLEARLRRASDQRKVHHGRHTPVSVAEASAAWTPQLEPSTDEVAPEPEEGPGRVVRVKEHPARPMSVDEALYEMELVGHDFFLFHDADSDRPSVVYRRHAFDYGVIRLA